MNQNEGSVDRFARVLLGSVLLSLVFFGPHTWFGVIPLFTGFVGFCPLYRVLGVSTRTVKT